MSYAVAKQLLLTLLIFLCATAGQAQAIESFKDAKWKATGGFGVSLMQYSRSGEIANRSSPLAYALNGNLRLSYGDFSIPISATYNNQRGSISNPFAFYGLSPSYKWATLHLGHRSIPFGKYLVSGQPFFGVGMELTPGKFRFAAAHGQLRSPIIQEDSLVIGAELFEPYRRTLTAARIGVGTNSNHFDVTVSRVIDREKEGDPSGADFLLPAPAENLGVSTKFNFSLAKVIQISGESALSVLTNEQGRDSLNVPESVPEFVSNAIELNESSSAHFAHDYGIGFRQRGFNTRLSFERVDPFYRSLGTPYLTDDIQRVRLQMGLAFGKGKVRVNGSVGRQRNNLTQLLTSTRERTIGSLGLTAKLSKELRLSARYSNFSSSLNQEIILVGDTLKRGQQTSTYSLSPVYTRRLETGSLRIGLRSTLRELDYGTSVRQQTSQLSFKSTVSRDWKESHFQINANASWRRSLTERTDVSLNRGNTVLQFGARISKGIKLGASESKAKETPPLKLGLSANLAMRKRESESDGSVFTLAATANYQPSRAHSLSLRLGLLRNTSPLADRSFGELRNNLSYRFTF